MRNYGQREPITGSHRDRKPDPHEGIRGRRTSKLLLNKACALVAVALWTPGELHFWFTMKREFVPANH
jgi:hypothetical protein